MKKLLLLSLLFFISFSLSFSQLSWGEMMDDPQANVYDIEQKLEKFKKDYPDRKIPKQFMRWLNRAYAFADAQGNIQRHQYINISKEYKRLINTSSRSSNWQHIGPTSTISLGGIGRMNSITFHPTDSMVMFAGSASGGVYKSVDHGLSWTTNTDTMPALGVSDIAINPKNPQIMYWATGDNDGNSTDSYGLLKSTDGGESWENVLDFGTSGYELDEIIIDPRNPDTVLLASSRGIHRTEDGGQSWTRVLNMEMEDIIFHPTNPDIVYASGNGGRSAYFRSTDNGVTWTGATSGIPATSPALNLGRMMLAVTPAAPDNVYLIIIKNTSGNYGYHGLYRSTDAGETFTTQSELSSNLDFRQGWWDLMINVDPQNPNIVYIADWRLYRSNNAGQTWVETMPQGLHVDFHDIEFHPTSGDIWLANDGGIYHAPNRNQATSFDIRSEGIAATQFYRLGTSVHDPTGILGGTQDNGTMEHENGGWSRAFGGDGMECIFSWDDPNFQVVSWQRGNVLKRSFGNISQFINANTTGETGAWTTPVIQSPSFARTFYAGYESVWITENQATWRNFSGPLSNTTLHKVLSPQISQGFFVYAATRNRLYRTLDKGVSWENRGFPGTMNDLIVLDDQARTLYAACNNGIFISTDAGDSWTDISQNLPSIPMTAIVYQRGGPEALYVGTTAGVYYTDSTMNGWEPFMTGLPNVEVFELEISYCIGKIRAATYGRGMWESELYPNGFQLLAVDIDVDPGTGNMDSKLTAMVSGGKAPFTYSWNNFKTTPSLENPRSGEYIITISDRNHCTVKDTAILMATSLEQQIDALADIAIYPNPVDDVLQIRLEAEKWGEISFKLFNTIGQKITTNRQNLNQGRNQFPLDVSLLKQGVYILQLEFEGQKLFHRFVKE